MVIGPHTRRPWRLGFAAVALVAIVGLAVEHIQVGQRGNQVNIVEAAFAFQFDPPRADFTFLNLILLVLQVTGQHVLLLDLKHRRREQGAVVRLILDPHFILLAQLRDERLAPTLRSCGTH